MFAGKVKQRRLAGCRRGVGCVTRRYFAICAGVVRCIRVREPIRWCRALAVLPFCSLICSRLDHVSVQRLEMEAL